MAAEKSDSVQFSRNPDILVVAHKTTLGFLEAGLVKFGWRIETAENIGEAIQMTKKLKPRMILVLAALGYMDTDGLRMLAKSKGDARLVLLDPTESLPKGIAGLDSTIRGSFPLHHLLAIVNSYVQT
jgi:DNA-binding response OmpR family regulator